MGRGTKLLGSGILNCGPLCHANPNLVRSGEMIHPEWGAYYEDGERVLLIEL